MYVSGCRLRVEVNRQSYGSAAGQWRWAEYDSVIVESEASNYTLHVTGYHGDAGDAFSAFSVYTDRWRSNGMPFSTPDVDNDQWLAGNCAVGNRCGWWFNWCSLSILNGMDMKWASIWSSVSASRMMMQCSAD